MDINVDWRRETSRVWPEVSYELRPLRVWAFQALMDRHEGLREAAESQDAQSQDAESRAGAGNGSLLALAARIFPQHVRAVEGLTVRREGQSQAVTAEALGEEALLLPLAGEILARLIALSEVGAAGEKK